MIRCIIIDDEAPARNVVKTFLKNEPDVEIISECDNGFDAFKQINELKPDLIFLDVQMPKLTGFEMLEILDQKPSIIFTTAYDQYALKAFEMNAIDYLLKPFSVERFTEALAKARLRISTDNSQNLNKLVEIVKEKDEKLDRIVVKSGSKISIVPVDTIFYINAEDDYVMLYTSSGRFLKQSTMNYLETHLDSSVFARIHRSTIINLTCIDKLERYEKETYMVILKNGDKLKTSKSGAKLLKEKLQL